MTRPYIPAGLDRGDGQYKAPHELVEYSPTIFDTSLDDADRDFRPLQEISMPADQQRARDVATDVARIMQSKGNLAELVRQHIEGLGLTLPRLYRLNRFARNNAVSGHKLAGQEGIPLGEWKIASRLVHRATLSILLDVPAQNRHDAIQLAGLVADALDPLPKAQRRRVAKQLARYFGAMLDGKHVPDAPKQWVWNVGDDSMAPAFPAGSNALYERHKGELVAGATTSFTAALVHRLRRSSGATWAPRRPAALWWSCSRTRLASHIAPSSTRNSGTPTTALCGTGSAPCGSFPISRRPGWR
jgi:hypothetical protein